MGAEIFNCFAHPYINSFVARMNLAVGQFDLHSYGLSCKGLRKILFYTPSVLEAPRSKFGIDFKIPPLSWGSAFFLLYTTCSHLSALFKIFFASVAMPEGGNFVFTSMAARPSCPYILTFLPAQSFRRFASFAQSFFLLIPGSV